MPALKLESFSGINPRTGPTLLADNQAQVASNLKIQSGEIRPWKSPTTVYSPYYTSATNSIYKFIGPAGVSPSYVWLEWTGIVDVVPGPVADLTDDRLYFTSTSFSVGPRKTNWALATGNSIGVKPFPNAYYELGVPYPTAAPTVTVAGTGTAPVETRTYIYTYVTQFGTVLEESAPSPPSVQVNVNFSGDSVTINNFATPPSGNYNFVYKRIYRSVVGTTSVGYELVAQIPIANTSYTDTVAAASLGPVLTSLYYTPPPSTLQGIVAMPNGILAGFTGNQIWFCEPYLPHAWPVNYMLTTDYPIVGLGTYNNSLFVGTIKEPYLVTGTTPASMSQEKLALMQPCISKLSIASDQYGVLYASPNGLVSISTGAADVITSSIFTRDDWQALNPASMQGVLYNDMYFGFYQTTGGAYNSLVLLRQDTPPLVNFSAAARAFYVEPTTGILNILDNTSNTIVALDTSTSSNTVFDWKSKKFLHAKPTVYTSLQVHADYVYMAANSGSYVTITVYADGTSIYSGNATSDYPIRIAGARAYVWEIEITGNVPVRRVNLASSMVEIGGI